MLLLLLPQPRCVGDGHCSASEDHPCQMVKLVDGCLECTFSRESADIGVAGFGIDATHAFAEKNRLQALADAAALAAATAMADQGNMSSEEAEALGLNAFVSQTLATEPAKTAAQKAEDEKKLKDSTTFAVSTTTSGNSETYDVDSSPESGRREEAEGQHHVRSQHNNLRKLRNVRRSNDVNL
ncbi:hypothetical protein ASD54_22880 [Rhizobium sp. Root149]|nr:hypothetical protein ASD54_22880 [Rhizobium sp. Root149]